MKLRRTNHLSHLFLGPFVVATGHHNTTVQNRTQDFGLCREISAMRRSMFHCETSAPLRIRLMSVAYAWGRSCLGIYRGKRIPRAKTSDRMVEQPTQWSKPSSPTSPKRFGLRTLRLRSPRFVAAAFVPLNAISAANENGRVSPSRSSSPRSCVATPCATSRSFPGGKHRPF